MWMNCKDVMLREMSQSQKDTLYGSTRIRSRSSTPTGGCRGRGAGMGSWSMVQGSFARWRELWSFAHTCVLHRTLKMIKVANFILRTFYHDLKTKQSKKQVSSCLKLQQWLACLLLVQVLTMFSKAHVMATPPPCCLTSYLHPCTHHTASDTAEGSCLRDLCTYLSHY